MFASRRAKKEGWLSCGIEGGREGKKDLICRRKKKGEGGGKNDYGQKSVRHQTGEKEGKMSNVDMQYSEGGGRVRATL